MDSIFPVDSTQIFLSSSRTKGTWDYGYLHPANGICTVNGDKLYFIILPFPALHRTSAVTNIPAVR